ncbi:MAG: biopolymer transporter ExbD [Gammaproteobacteria bacterium]|nr:biopolymer transporter ExbD [Gammaproteobacteria bacterium]MBT8133536.1 biopolymer transporter ExbD [Gammaproteobacteria bacterium]NNJ49055.1 biopolymer transporter ExbD [Gammaproteobacteria bacterium]
MNLRPGHKEESVEVNLTPLIDVVFLLLIFFMVTTTFDRHARLKVSLPESSAKTTQQKDQPLILSIDAKGNYFLNDRQIVNQQLDTLKQALQKVIGEKGQDYKDVALVLRADANTPHQSVVRAMDAASQLGMTRLSIATVEGN